MIALFLMYRIPEAYDKKHEKSNHFRKGVEKFSHRRRIFPLTDKKTKLSLQHIPPLS